MATSRRARRAPRSDSPRALPQPRFAPRKPMAMARRVSLFEREVVVRLAPVAVELLHGAARVLSEGELTGDFYAGSTMLTVDLGRTVDRIADPPDASTAQKVAL